MASGEIVGGERAGDGDNDHVINHQRRTREAPIWNLPTSVGCGVARPHDLAVTGVERVQDPGRTEGVDAIFAEGGRCARTGAAVRLPEPDCVAVSPYWLTGGHLVTGDDLVLTALLLSVEEVAADGEG